MSNFEQAYQRSVSEAHTLSCCLKIGQATSRLRSDTTLLLLARQNGASPTALVTMFAKYYICMQESGSTHKRAKTSQKGTGQGAYKNNGPFSGPNSASSGDR